MTPPVPASATGNGGGRRYWFVRAARGRYPDAFVPVTIEGRVIYWLMWAGLALAWVALIVIGQVYGEPIWAGVVTAIILVVSVSAYAFVSRRFGDRDHSPADYAGGRLVTPQGNDDA